MGLFGSQDKAEDFVLYLDLKDEFYATYESHYVPDFDGLKDDVKTCLKCGAIVNMDFAGTHIRFHMGTDEPSMDDIDPLGQ